MFQKLRMLSKFSTFILLSKNYLFRVWRNLITGLAAEEGEVSEKNNQFIASFSNCNLQKETKEDEEYHSRASHSCRPGSQNNSKPLLFHQTRTTLLPHLPWSTTCGSNMLHQKSIIIFLMFSLKYFDKNYLDPSFPLLIFLFP